MELGGNAAFRTFWESKHPGGLWKVSPTTEVLAERYGGEIGQEWRERLGCQAEGREFVGVPEREVRRKEESPARSSSMPGRKEVNEAYFARMGNENKSRPEGVAPSQGGKYAGFGSVPARVEESGEEEKKGMPGVDDFQRDPVGALSQGLGWFTSSVGKGARQVNEGWVRPTAQKVRWSSPHFLSNHGQKRDRGIAERGGATQAIQ